MNFTQKKIVLAVGAGLMAMAGVANAALPTGTPAARTAKPILTVAASQGNADSLYNQTSGFTGALPAKFYIAITAIDSAGAGANHAAITAGTDGLKINNANNAGTTTSACIATDDICVYVGTAGATQTNLMVTNASVTLTTSAQVSTATAANGVANANFTITTAGNEALRHNATTGVLEYTANKTASPVVWQTVNATVQAPTSTTNFNGFTASDSTAASVNSTNAATQMAAIAAQSIFSSVAPTITVKTHGSAAGLVDGYTVDYVTPLVAAPAVGATAAIKSIPVNVNTAACATGQITSPNTVNFANPTAPATGLSAGALVAGTTATYNILFATPATADWTTGNATADAAVYTKACFNTGLAAAAEVPFNLTATATGADQSVYTLVFNAADGAASKVTALPVTATDGAAPIINSITFDNISGTTATSTADLKITFSENMAAVTNGTNTSNLRELLENIKVGSTTLAALSMNSGATPTWNAPTNGTLASDMVKISALNVNDLATLSAGIWTGKSVVVSPSITTQEVNDSSYVANSLDRVTGTGANDEELAGGVATLTANAVAAGTALTDIISSTTMTATAPAVVLVWGTDTSATASASSASNPDLIDTITVTFAAGKTVKLAPTGTIFGTATALAAAKTATDLANNLVVDVFGSNGIVFQVRPTTAVLNAAGSSITVTVPTALIYSKLTSSGAQLKSVWIGYNADGATNATNTNYTLISSTAGTTPTAGEILAKGLNGSAGGTAAWITADLTAAGAEPVVLPLVFTATQTFGQSTLLTQNIQTNLAGAAAGDKVDAYLAYWVDLPKVQATVTSASLKSGKITNPGDKVATDLAIEFVDGAGAADAGVVVAAAIETELRAAKPAAVAKPGINDVAAAVPAKPLLMYVKLVRSNDVAVGGVNGGTPSAAAAGASTGQQAMLHARALMGTTYAAAKAAGGSLAALDPVYEVMLDPNTGKISGRLVGDIAIKVGSTTTTARGLRFLDEFGADKATATAQGSSIVAQKSATNLALPGTANLNLLMGIDPKSANYSAIMALDPFVLLVHQDATGKYTMLSSADPTAANYVAFKPDVLNLAVGTGGIAIRATTPLSVTDIKSFDLPVSANWALYGLGKPAKAAKPAVVVAPDKAFPRMFVGLNTVAGTPVSLWTSDAGAAAADALDVALSMAGNQVGVATELQTDTGGLTGPTLSNIGGGNQVANAVAVAWRNAFGGTDGATAKLDKLYVAQATGVFAPAVTAPAPALNPGWSLVTVPGTVGTSVTSLGTVVDAVIKVGAQVGLTGTTLTAQGTGSGVGKGQFTWFAVDGAMPALTAGEAVFVHAKAKGSL